MDAVRLLLRAAIADLAKQLPESLESPEEYSFVLPALYIRIEVGPAHVQPVSHGEVLTPNQRLVLETCRAGPRTAKQIARKLEWEVTSYLYRLLKGLVDRHYLRHERGKWYFSPQSGQN